MIILDTNVLSELMRPNPNPAVLRWVNGFDMGDLWTTSITVAEILVGIALLPEGRRRRDLETAARQLFADLFDGRVVDFTTASAEFYGEIVSARTRRGQAVPSIDMMITAIARANGAAIATRNVADFDGCGIDVIDPWTAG